MKIFDFDLEAKNFSHQVSNDMKDDFQLLLNVSQPL